MWSELDAVVLAAGGGWRLGTRAAGRREGVEHGVLIGGLAGRHCADGTRPRVGENARTCLCACGVAGARRSVIEMYIARDSGVGAVVCGAGTIALDRFGNAFGGDSEFFGGCSAGGSGGLWRFGGEARQQAGR